MPKPTDKCLICQNTFESEKCDCPGGFKILWRQGIAVSERELHGVPTFTEALDNVKKEAKQIKKLLDGDK